MIKCTESFEVRGYWVNCNNPASLMAKTYKHGDEQGICAQCLIRKDKENDQSYFDRHSFRGANC